MRVQCGTCARTAGVQHASVNGWFAGEAGLYNAVGRRCGEDDWARAGANSAARRGRGGGNRGEGPGPPGALLFGINAQR